MTIINEKKFRYIEYKNGTLENKEKCLAFLYMKFT